MGIRCGSNYGNPKRRELLAGLVLLALSLFAVAGCMTPPAPSERPRDVDDDLRRLLSAQIAGEEEALLRHLLPAIRYGMEKVLASGYAEEVSRADFYHLHLLVPLTEAVIDPAFLGLRDKIVLLFHTRERPPEIRLQWIDELDALGAPEIASWVAEIRASEFDYEDFFYGSRRHEPRPAIPVERVRALAETWQEHGSPDSTIGKLEDRIVVIQGSRQPGYYGSADRLFSPRSLLFDPSKGTLEATATTPPEYVSVGTVYFSPARTPGRRRIVGIPSRQGLTAIYLGYEFVFVSASAI